MRFPTSLVALLAFAPALLAENCFLMSGQPQLMRQEGRAELVGDIMLQCMNGTGPRTVDFTLTLSPAVASRVLNQFRGRDASEALLLVDEPGVDPSRPAVPCSASSAGCAGANVYQGRVAGPASLIWTNVQVNVPADGMGVQTFRFTNLRVDASWLGDSSPTAPPPIATASLTTSDPALEFPNDPMLVGFNVPSLAWQLRDKSNQAELPGPLTFRRCEPNNLILAVNPFSARVPDGVSFILRLTEMFPWAFRKQATTGAEVRSAEVRPAPEAQNIPGAMYYTETGFFDPSYPSTDGMNHAGLATQATRFIVTFDVPDGMRIHAPIYEAGTDSSNSRVRLVAANHDGAAPLFIALPALSPFNHGLFYLPKQSYVYEITARTGTQPWMMEEIDLPFVVAYLPNAKAGSARVSVNLAPLADDDRRLGQAAVPRFKNRGEWRNFAVMEGCGGGR